MELELGIKLTKVVDGFTATEFSLAKDRTGPLFLSTETNSMFILTAHLKGFGREHIKIDINEDGTRIEIRGERRVQETVMVGYKMHKKEAHVSGFKKAFRIPDGVVLDEISARFSEEESTLTISMPKLLKGIPDGNGGRIEEVKEEEVIAKDDSEVAQEFSGKELKEPNILGRKKPSGSKVTFAEEVDDLMKCPRLSPSDKDTSVADQEPIIMTVQEPQMCLEKSTDDDHQNDDEECEGTLEDNSNGASLTERRDQANQDHEKSHKFCVPIIAGSALMIVSFIVFVIGFIRTNKNRSSKRRN